ncbi:hypothetical protein KIN20_028523 [Parelaphostrongylus tenuis]|uniref:Uncharacterized protein n=1 Tax=Parelaphostrongylus tenuis TaxID=148309 RepID=A0AAD5WF46_PARTN|nr:hypothetical protein KIN20_028523 [Parelaphostrongylus tenuis]
MALGASPNPLQPRHSDAVETGILEKSASLLPSLRLEELITLVVIVTAVFFKSLPIGVVLGFILLIYMAFVGLFLILDIKFDLWKKLRENRGLHDIFLEVVEKNRDKTAMIDIETGRVFTFEEFNKECNRYANYFQVKNDTIHSCSS